MWNRIKRSEAIRRDLDAANMRPALEHVCGKQTPSANILFDQANLVYVPNVNM